LKIQLEDCDKQSTIKKSHKELDIIIKNQKQLEFEFYNNEPTVASSPEPTVKNARRRKRFQSSQSSSSRNSVSSTTRKKIKTNRVLSNGSEFSNEEFDEDPEELIIRSQKMDETEMKLSEIDENKMMIE
jgi:hypothetical protein